MKASIHWHLLWISWDLVTHLKLSGPWFAMDLSLQGGENRSQAGATKLDCPLVSFQLPPASHPVESPN